MKTGPMPGPLIVVCFLIACTTSVASWLWQRGFPANENWKCSSGCPSDQNATDQIFGMIRHALYTESREVFLNMDHSWIDTMLAVRAQVNVIGVPRDKLASFKAPDYHSPDWERDEVFQVIYSLPPNQGPFRPLNLAEGEIIDSFLTHNPCWIPIHDPPAAVPNMPVEVSTHHSGIFDYTAIFVRLPAFWFHSTCKLFEMIHRIQFPATCPTATSNLTKVRSYWVGNIGWANCVHPIVERLRESLFVGNMLINPRAFDTGASDVLRVVNGKNYSLRGHWRWASPTECDPDTYYFNPWHCHFLSITGCNTPELRDTVPFQDNWQYSSAEREKFMTLDGFKEIEAIKADREKYGDGPRLGNEWLESRVLAFIVRPNILMRTRLRRTLASSLVFLKPGHSIAPIFDPTNNAAAAGTEQQHAHSHISAHHAQEPRMGLHVRDGDSRNDARIHSPVNRSFQAHMACLQEFATKLGVRNIYMATDNVTLFSLAPEMYPQFGWLAQQRSLKVFEGHSFVGYFNEKSVHQDVANMLADLIFMSRTVGLVGSHDGGFYVLFAQHMCLRNRMGLCPPGYSIQDCQHKG